VSKGPDAFRTISEAAKELDLPQHVLRFWETRFNQIKPMKRGGGRRYYRPDDVALLRGIRYLLYGEGYTIRGVQRILREQGLRFVIGAGRGEVAGLTGRAGDIDFDMPDEDDAAELTAANDEVDGSEPAFDPREYRKRPPRGVANGSAEPAKRLTNDEVNRLETTLTELHELKRLLDQSR
jgi:DNA-binding transcriptional MerR regulator